jgi:hypothetical protein
MPPSSTNDSFANGLRKILGDVAQLSTVPDADLAFCSKLQVEIVQHLRMGLQQAFGGMMSQDVMPPSMAGPPPGTMTGGGSPGLSPGMPAVDELSRMLGNQGQVQ